MRESRVRVRCVIGLHHSAHRSHCTDVTGGHIDGCDELNILAHVDIDIREFDEGQAEEHGLLNGDWGVIVGVISTLIAMGLMFGGSKKARTRRAKQKARDMWSVWQDEGH